MKRIIFFFIFIIVCYVTITSSITFKSNYTSANQFYLNDILNQLKITNNKLDQIIQLLQNK